MSEKITVLSQKNFDEVVGGSDVAVVDFWASWCGPCKMLLPVIDQLAEDYDGKAKVCKVNVDDSAEVAEQFGVNTIPTVIIFKNGKEAERSVGFRQKAQLAAIVDKYL